MSVAALFSLVVPAPAQEAQEAAVARKAVDLKERAETEKALDSLMNRWTQYFQKPAKRPPAKLKRSSSSNVLMAPEAEKQAEAALAAPQRQSLARESKAGFEEPKVLTPNKKGVLKVDLEAGYAHNHIGKDPVYLRSFNGKLVGPTLKLKPGNKLRLTLRNTMPGERWEPHMMNKLNSFNTTNVHYHGLHVSPDGISDNVLIQVGPHETQEYELDIPADHTPGTYWYHPHRHGSTAGNVASSMSGAFIIEGGLDDIPEIRAAKDRVMVLNQIPYLYKNTLDDPSSKTDPPAQTTFDFKEGIIEAKYADYIFGPGDWAALGRYTTINGVQLPVIEMKPGQVERWRLIDSGQRETIMLKIIPAPTASGKVAPEIKFHEIAVDGLALGKMVEKTTIELWPGYRSDVLVQAPEEPGEYLLIDEESSGTSSMNGQLEPLNYVARLRVAGKPAPMKLPTSEQMKGLRLPSIPDKDITGPQTASYGIQVVGGKTVFSIDGKPFDMETARTLKLNEVNEWTLDTNNTVANGLVTHPFHIHVNPFEVTSIMSPVLDADGNMIMENGKPKLVEEVTDGPVWRDTVKIPGNGYVKMRTRYTDFVGTFVQHCHILDHEDQGMMQLIDIQSDKPEVSAAPASSVPAVGSKAPDFNLPDAGGKTHSLSDLAGKPVVLFFFKGHGCLHCVQQVTAFTEQYKAFVGKGIQVVGVTSDDAGALKEALADYPCPFTLLADPEGHAFARFGCVAPGGLQHGTFSIDSGHRVTWSTVGASPYLDVGTLAKPVSSHAAAAAQVVSK